MSRFFFSLFLLILMALRTTATVVTVTVQDYYFSPAMFTINPGDTITWVWIDGHHNTSSTSVPTGGTTWYSNIMSTTTTYSIVPNVSGLYKYTCTHHSGMDGQFFVTGCTYPAKPVISSLNGNAACHGDTVVLTTPTQAGITYTWLKGMTTAPSTTYFLNATESGSYKVIVNRCGMDSVSDPFTVTVHPLPEPSFSYSNTGLDHSFVNTTTDLGDHAFEWNFGDGSPVQSAVNAQHSFTAPGNYIVSLKATHNVNTCDSIFSKGVQVSLGIANVFPVNYRIFPNPAATYIEIEAGANALAWISDASGRILITPTAILPPGSKIDVTSLAQGIYILCLSVNGYIFTDKITIIR